jgi:hypothetical protein
MFIFQSGLSPFLLMFLVRNLETYDLKSAFYILLKVYYSTAGETNFNNC